MAWRIRPGFGSPPKAAVLTNRDSAIARATVRASASESAPVISTSKTCLPPSASAASLATSVRPTSSTASASASQPATPGRTGSAPPAPLASSNTVSLVLEHPSTVSDSNAGTALPSCRSRTSPADSMSAGANFLRRAPSRSSHESGEAPARILSSVDCLKPRPSR